MAKIKTYIDDLVISKDDRLLGSDNEYSNKPTRQYKIGDLVDFFNSSNTIDGITYIYSSNNTDKSISGNLTSDTDIIKSTTKLYINRITSTQSDAEILFNTIKDDNTPIFIKLSENGNPVKIAFLKINSISKETTDSFYVFNVSLIGNLGYGKFIDGEKYNLSFGFLPMEGSTEQPFLEDITLIMEEENSFGIFKNGDTIPSQGKTAKEVIAMSLVGTVNPIITPPSASMVNDINQTKEVGETIQVKLTVLTSKGNIKGDIVNGKWDSNASQGTRAQNVNYTIEGQSQPNNTRTVAHTVTRNKNEFTGKAIFSGGIQPINSNGQPFGSPFTSLTIDMDTSFQGAYKVFYGASDVVGNIRALPFIYENAGNTFNLVSGTTDSNFHIFLPPNKILESVLSVEASNANITSQYIDQGFVNVNDAGGNNTSYKHYKMTTDKPYDENNTHKITIKNG